MMNLFNSLNKVQKKVLVIFSPIAITFSGGVGILSGSLGGMMIALAITFAIVGACIVGLENTN